jgi:hypothetical protein
MVIVLFCNKCGARINDDSKFCESCGQNQVIVANATHQPQQSTRLQEQQLKNYLHPSKGLAITSIILGILPLATFYFWFIAIPLSIIAVILAVVAKSKGYKGGMATVGLVLGIVGAIPAIIFVSIAAITIVTSNVSSTMSNANNQVDVANVRTIYSAATVAYSENPPSTGSYKSDENPQSEFIKKIKKLLGTTSFKYNYEVIVGNNGVTMVIYNGQSYP